jgi:hypothetical protein
MAYAWRTDVLWLEACENYQKGSYRNRCHIAGSNGVQRLSIPLQKGKHQQTPIREVRLAYDEPWQRTHWRSIRTAYGNAPFFEHYADEVAPFFEKKYTFLFDLNLDVLHFLMKKMAWPGEIRLSETYRMPGMEDTVTDARNSIVVAGFNPPPIGSVVPGFNPPPIGSVVPGFNPPPKSYPQLFMERHGFLPDLSALDLLFCCGKQAGAVFS